MSVNVTRPSFEANGNVAQNKPVSQELIATRQQRQEIGCIWNRNSKSTNMQFYKVRLNFTKEQLQEMLNGPTTENGTIQVEYVAFPNSGISDNPRRPAYRIFPAIDN